MHAPKPGVGPALLLTCRAGPFKIVWAAGQAVLPKADGVPVLPEPRRLRSVHCGVNVTKASFVAPPRSHWSTWRHHSPISNSVHVDDLETAVSVGRTRLPCRSDHGTLRSAVAEREMMGFRVRLEWITKYADVIRAQSGHAGKARDYADRHLAMTPPGGRETVPGETV